MTIKRPFSFKKWIDNNRDMLKPPVGNQVIYKVRVDGVGVRECINSTIDIIRVGDIVSVTLFNNPVEA